MYRLASFFGGREKTACFALELISLDSIVLDLAFSYSFWVVNTLYRKGTEMQEKFLKIIVEIIITYFRLKINYKSAVQTNGYNSVCAKHNIIDVVPIGTNEKNPTRTSWIFCVF